MNPLFAVAFYPISHHKAHLLIRLHTYGTRKRQKKEKALEKEKQKEKRERKKAEKMAATKKDTDPTKMPTQEASVESTNEKTRKGKGNTTVKDTRDLDTCMIFMA